MTRAVQPSRILFVDDESVVQSAFCRGMQKRGFRVDLATSGAEAVRLAKDVSYAVIVTDLRMPEMDGFTLIEHLRPMQPSAAFVVVTGMPELDGKRSRDQDRSAIVSIVAKPWEDDHLASVLRRAVKIHEYRSAQSLNTVKKSLLLVEDNPGDAELVEEYLSLALPGAYRIDRAERLADAVEGVESHEYSVIIADLSLPDARGLDIIEKLRQAAPDTPVVVLSGLDDEALALETVQMGAQDYLVKGDVDRRSLGRAIRYAVERKRTERKLTELAHFDQLTGLVNRSLFHDRLSHALARCRRKEIEFGVMFLDLDRFKAVNDTLGHDVGDGLLREVAARLKEAVRDYDTVARLGGDEFAILVESPADEACMHTLAERILRALRQPVIFGGHQMAVTSSVGIATFPGAGRSSQELLKAADLAMYEAKEGGRNTFRVFSMKNSQGNQAKRDLEQRIRRATCQREFTLHYQPQFDLKNGRVTGLEALLRWPQKDGGWISPAEFIPVLEKTGLIVEIGNWVLSQACRELARWKKEGLEDFRIAVNLSARQFEGDGLIAAVEHALHETGLEPACLELEITESLLMQDTDRANATLERLKSLGVRIAIDDFGTGYSSLAYLHRFSVDVLKIDRAFVDSIGKGKGGELIAMAILSLGHKLELEVIAEGIETRVQLERLQSEGCDAAQGFYLGRPAADWSLHDLKTAGAKVYARAA